MSKMVLPADFQFSQASLQDYVECRRRFQLRYLLQLQWPAPEAEPAEEHEQRMQDGETFHRLVHLHRHGIPTWSLTPRDEGPVAEWWRAYLASPPDLPERQYPERTLTVPLGEHRLVAKLDLLAIEPLHKAVIVDWKTGQKRQGQSWLASRLQTRVYRYALAQAGAHLNDGEPIPPEQIRMVYWFAVDPEHPETLLYDETQMAADGRFLLGLAESIAVAAEADDFPRTEDVRRCLFCSYRSLCNRGVEAGQWDAADADDAETEPDFDWKAGIDFEQIAEIAF
jgi:CRISPR/Cas system-associated exonuclease Cas4 (RecB family)